MKGETQNKTVDGTRSFSTYARRRAKVALAESRPPSVDQKGHMFELPSLPLPSDANLKYRYDPIVKQLTNLLMRDGKIGVAQRVRSSVPLFSFCADSAFQYASTADAKDSQSTATILNQLRTAPPPTINPTRPLVPGAPPASHLPLNPILYMTLAIDSVAPLFRVKYVRKLIGGGVALAVPVPLSTKQRRRQAFVWVLDAASKRKMSGSGRWRFAQKVAEEIIAVAEGRSGIWERRSIVHKNSVAARANLNKKVQ